VTGDADNSISTFQEMFMPPPYIKKGIFIHNSKILCDLENTAGVLKMCRIIIITASEPRAMHGWSC